MVAVPFPSDWSTLLVLMPHPDDPEYMSAAVAKWVRAGKRVRYLLASRGEAGIEGMPPQQAAVVREAEQRHAAAIVGVRDVTFWDEPDSEIRNTAALRNRITEALTVDTPDIVVTMYGGAEWSSGAPNQRDHIEFAAAARQAVAAMGGGAPRLFESSYLASHIETVDGHVETAVRALAAHERYFTVLDPDTPVLEQARSQLARAFPLRDDGDGTHPVAQFQLIST